MDNSSFNINDLINPIKFGNTVVSSTQTSIDALLKDIDKNAKIDKEANKETTSKYDKAVKQTKIFGVLIILSILIGITSIIFGVIAWFSFDDLTKQIKTILTIGLIITGVILIVLGIFLIPKRKKNNADKDMLLAEAYKQMKDVNSYLKYDTIKNVIHKIFPWANFDEFLNTNNEIQWNNSLQLSDKKCVGSYLSGFFNKTPFLLCHIKKMTMVMKTYSGSYSRTITSNGVSKNVYRTESFQHPAPEYTEKNTLFFNSDVAKDLSFSPKTGIFKSNKKLPLENGKFNKYFSKIDWNNDQGMRFLFTILAQENIVKLYDENGPYSYTKNKNMNIISNKNYNNKLNFLPRNFTDYSYENFQSKIKYNIVTIANTFYWLFSVILAIPAFVHFPDGKKTISKYKTNDFSPIHAQMILQNYFDKNNYVHSSTRTDHIIEVKMTKVTKTQQIFLIVAHSFDAINKTKYINGARISYVDYLSLKRITYLVATDNKTKTPNGLQTFAIGNYNFTLMDKLK